MKNRESFARRITKRLLLWMIFIVFVLSCILVYTEQKATREYYAEIYSNKMHVTKEYIRRVLSDVYVAVTNNIYYLEHTLDNPDEHKVTMERIVRSGTRIRRCGISFIKDYYPEKGHQFVPFAWRSLVNHNIIDSQDLGDAHRNYLEDEWFLEIIRNDSAHWSEPFYDGFDQQIPIVAYDAPIHDKDGHVVAVLGADLPLDWLSSKITETDSVINDNSLLQASMFEMKSNSFVIDPKGNYLTNANDSNIIKDNFFNQLESCHGSSVDELAKKIQGGVEPKEWDNSRYLFNGEECFVFYTHVKYTDWTMITIVPCRAIDVIGYLNAGVMILMILLAMLIVIIIAYYQMKYAAKPMKQLNRLVDKITEGNYDIHLPDVKYNDEMKKLSNSLEEMQYKLFNIADKANQDNADGTKQDDAVETNH